MDKIEQSSFALLPNPASDFIQINMEKGIPKSIQIVDAQGRLVLKTEISTIDLSEFQSGIYFVKILLDGIWSQQRLFKY